MTREELEQALTDITAELDALRAELDTTRQKEQRIAAAVEKFRATDSLADLDELLRILGALPPIDPDLPLKPSLPPLMPDRWTTRDTLRLLAYVVPAFALAAAVAVVIAGDIPYP